MPSKIRFRFLPIVLAIAVFVCCGLVFTACDSDPDTDIHKITFYSSDGANATVLGVVCTNGNESITLPEIPRRVGYRANGFAYYVNSDVDNNTEFTFTADTFKNVELTQDINVYARYSVESYLVHYIIDDVDASANVSTNDARSLNDVETPTLDAIYYYINEDKDMLLPEATKDGYIFKGWYLTDSFEQKIEYIKAGSTGNITLYARFEAI